jgi:hypothetical protein
VQHRIVGLDLGPVRPTADQIIGVLIDRRIRNVRDVGERGQRMGGGFLIAQIHRDEPKLSPTRQVRFAPRNADDIPVRRQK